MNQPPDSRFCCFGEWVLDTQTRELRHGNDVTAVQNVPGRLLEVLLRAASTDADDPGLRRVIGYLELKRAVWGQRRVGDHSVHTAVKQIRRDLGDPELVETIAGKGYRYVGPRPRWYDTLDDGVPLETVAPAATPTQLTTDTSPDSVSALSRRQQALVAAIGGLAGALIVLACFRLAHPALARVGDLGWPGLAAQNAGDVTAAGTLAVGVLSGIALFGVNILVHASKRRLARWGSALLAAALGGTVMLGAHLVHARDARPHDLWMVFFLQGSAIAVALCLPCRLTDRRTHNLLLVGALPVALGAVTWTSTEFLLLPALDAYAGARPPFLLPLVLLGFLLFSAVVFHFLRRAPMRTLSTLVVSSVVALVSLPLAGPNVSARGPIDPPRIVFLAPSVSPSSSRDVTQLVFELVSQRLQGATQRRIIEGCDWVAIFVPRFPDELLEPEGRITRYAYPLPLPELLDGVAMTRALLEAQPFLSQAGPALTRDDGGASAPQDRTISASLLSDDGAISTVSVRVLNLQGQAVLALQTSGSTAKEAADAAAEQLVRNLWPLHSTLFRFNRAFERSRSADCVPLRSQAMLSTEDRSAFEELLVELDPLINSANLAIRRFAWDLQGAVYLHGLRDPERGASAFEQLRWRSEHPTDDPTRAFQFDALFELAQAAYAKRDWGGAVAHIDGALELARRGGAPQGAPDRMHQVLALSKRRQSSEERAPDKSLKLLLEARAALAVTVGDNPRAVANVHRLALSQLEYLAGSRLPAASGGRAALEESLRDADALVREFPDDYNHQLWRVRVHRLARLDDLAGGFGRAAIERFPCHVALMIETASAELDAGRRDAARRVADQAAVAFNDEVRKFFQKRPALATTIWPRRSLNRPQPIVPLMRLALDTATARGDGRGLVAGGPPVLSDDVGLDPEREEIDLHLLRARILRCDNRNADAYGEVRRAFEVAATSQTLLSPPCESASATECLHRLQCSAPR